MNKNNYEYFNTNERWFYNPYQNYNFLPNYFKIDIYRKNYYSATNYKFKKSYFWITIAIFYGLFFLFSIAQTFNTIFPEFSNSINNYRIIRHQSFLFVRYYFPFIAGILWMFYLIQKLNKTFLTSGIFTIFMYNFVTTSTGILLIWSSDFASFYQTYGNWFHVINLLIIIVIAMIYVKDIKRSLLIIFIPYTQVDNYYNNNKNSNKFLTSKKNIWSYFSWTLLLIFILFLVMWYFIAGASNILANFITRFISIVKNSNQESINSSLSTNIFWLKTLPTIILVVIMAPLVEEIVFRLGLNSLGNNNWSSIFFSGLIFGLIHTHSDGLFNILLYSSFGFVSGLAYVYTGNIWTVILMHFTNNFLSILV